MLFLYCRAWSVLSRCHFDYPKWGLPCSPIPHRGAEAGLFVQTTRRAQQLQPSPAGPARLSH